MNWLQRYHARLYVRQALWILPLVGMVAALVVVRVLHQIEIAEGWELAMDPDTARAVLGTLSSAMFTFVVFVCSALLVAVQLASAQLTPRIIALVFSERGTQLALTLFVSTFTFCLAVLVRITTSVPLLTTEVAAYSCLASLAVFLYLVDRVGKHLRPSGAVRMVALRGREVIESVYPDHLAGKAGEDHQPADFPVGVSPVTITCRTDGAVLAFDAKGLYSLARQADCVIELVPRVGDFIAVGDPLFRVYQTVDTHLESQLRRSVAIGQERTMEQDPTFSLRILVDIASKGLSPAINDPTTAVLVIDQIHHLLRTVGSRRLDSGTVCDPEGRLRLVYRTPNWEDFVQLAVTEIRQFGSSSIQVARRLRAMLENLIQTLPEARAALLRQELSLIHRSVERSFSEPEDRAMADLSDLQGVGGTSVPPGGPPR